MVTFQAIMIVLHVPILNSHALLLHELIWRRARASLKKALAERGIQFREAKTAEACKLYNQALKEGKRMVVALHLTC